jgi:hypothetical protein
MQRRIDLANILCFGNGASEVWRWRLMGRMSLEGMSLALC